MTKIIQLTCKWINMLAGELQTTKHKHINKKRKKNQQNKNVWVTIPWFIVGSKDNCTELVQGPGDTG